jgi:hypothetical protein
MRERAKDNLRISFGTESASGRDEFLAQFDIVEDLPVVDEHISAILGDHWLVRSIGNVEYFEPPGA